MVKIAKDIFIDVFKDNLVETGDAVEYISTNISTDSRRILEGQTFIALTGENFDGHNYLGSVLNINGSTALIEKQVDLELSKKCIQVKMHG